MPQKPSEKLQAVIERLRLELTPDEELILEQARQTFQRLEQGEGFSVKAVVNIGKMRPRIDVCWMGMLAQIEPEQARSMGLGLIQVAVDAEAQAALVRFLKETGIDDTHIAQGIGTLREMIDAMRPQESVQGLVQEPSAQDIAAVSKFKM